jgi:prepilin-type N-terminal cleavage/methylation domain-containing protein
LKYIAAQELREFNTGMKKTDSKPSAFTLVEIMITLSVITLLMALAVPITLNVLTHTKINQAELELEIIANAVRKLAWDTGRWPNKYLHTHPNSNVEIWDLNAAAAGIVTNDGSYSNWDGPYMDTLGTDPWGQPYFFDPDYRVDGQNRIVVGSFGPNQTGRNRYDSDDVYVLLDED